MEILLGVDEFSYSNKPGQYEFNEIRKRAARNWKNYSLSSVANEIGQNGHAFVAGHLIGGVSNCNCTEMQVFALDFDNDKYHISIQSVLDRCTAKNISPAFAYHTYSSTKENNRFRVVFITEFSIKDNFVIPIIFHMLLTVFPEADHSCKDSARVFLGGKKLIFCNEDARINLQCLIESTETELCKDSSHRNERLSSFANKTQIQKINGMPAMGPVDRMDLFFRDIEDPAINKYIHIVGEYSKSPIFILEKSKLVLENSTCKDTSPHRIDSKNFVACPILEEFLSGKHIEHNVRFSLLTNLLHIKGGISRFKEALLKHYDEDTNKKWDKEIQYVKYHGYHPARCDSFCPYAKDCDHASTPLHTLLSDRKIYSLSKPVYCSLEEAEVQLSENMSNAINSDIKGIHLIRAQTGIGKTAVYTEMVANKSSMRAVIALPTNKLKEEVYERLLKSGVKKEDIFMTPKIKDNPFIPLDVQETISAMHEQGIHNQTKQIIGDLIGHNNSYGTFGEDELRKIVLGMGAFKNERIILTTHAYFMYMSQRFLQDRIIFIDEDILLNLFFSRIYTVNLSEIEKAQSSYDTRYQHISSLILSSSFETYNNISSPQVPSETTNTELTVNKNIGNLFDLQFATTFVKHRSDTGNYVRYFCRSSLPANKYIILSATLDNEIYSKFFPNLRVVQYPYKEACYQGTLTQYTYHSLGRGDLDSRLDNVCSFVKSYFKSQLVNLICFKKILSNNTVKKNNLASRMNFGNTMGFNELSGQDLAIVGTYFKQEDAYKLVAAAMGAEVNKKENKHPRQHRVEYNNYSFILMTYPDYLLQRIQLYSICSEQEQSVGRARLLRNNCKVLLLSAFPCSQAQLNTREYLS